MKQIPHLTYGEQFALDEWLTYYPEDMSYANIIKLLMESDWSHEAISVWDVVERYPLSQVAEFIEDTRLHFDRVVGGACHE
jgi:hypothetical protein